MSVPTPSGYDPTNPVPGTKVMVQLGANARSVAGQRKLMLLGNKRSTGTASTADPVSVSSPDEADTLFGVGSELALMCRAAFKACRTADVNACAVAEGTTPTAATATLVFANSAGTAGVIKVTINGVRVPDVAVAASAASTTIATDVAAAINGVTQLPVTAGVSSSTVTVTARQGGTKGNQIGLEVVLTTTTTTCAISGGSASATRARARLTGGLVDDSITLALAACATGEWFFVCASNDATNADLLSAHLSSYAAIDECKRQQGVIALKAVAFATAKSFGIARNAARLQIAYQRDQPAGGEIDPMVKTCGEIAANVATARLYGDGGVGNGGKVRGEIVLASQNLNGLQLAACPAVGIAASAFIGTELKQLLQSGISPIMPSNENPAISQLVKSVTSYCRDGSSNLTYAVHDTSKVTVCDLVADRLEVAIAADHPNKNIAVEPTPTRAPPDGAVYLSGIRATGLRVLYDAEGEGLLVNVAANEDAVVFAQHPDNASLVVAALPAEVIPHFHNTAATVLQTG